MLHWFPCIGQSVGNVTWADVALQINDLPFVSKLVILLQLHIICNYVTSTALSGIVFALKLFASIILLILYDSQGVHVSNKYKMCPDDNLIGSYYHK